LSVIHCTVCVFVYNVCSVSAYTFQENTPQVLTEVVDWFDYYLFHVTWWDKVICGMSVAISEYSDFALILTLHILMIAMRMFYGQEKLKIPKGVNRKSDNTSYVKRKRTREQTLVYKHFTDN
jgi:hypothetical protein